MLYNLFENRDFVSVFAVALLAEGVDRNIYKSDGLVCIIESPSSRRAWIEILEQCWYHNTDTVALLAEGVDRNPESQLPYLQSDVALLAEGVDRNLMGGIYSRNAAWSPSSRRAWIEITPACTAGTAGRVALLAEGVDRNLLAMMVMVPSLLSPSSRRAWIEIRQELRRPC